MTTSVTLPKMGESVVEGTIIRWLKQEGEFVKEDEPLVEISTDKIDTELPSPASGVVSKILAAPDETVEVGAEIAQIDESASEGEKAKAPPKEDKKEDKPSKADEQEEEPAKEEKAEAPAKEEKPAEEAEEAPPPKAEEKPAEKKPAPPAEEPAARTSTPSDGGALSPLVRKLARERGVDISAIRGSGSGGRITKEDVLAAADGGARPAAAQRVASPAPSRAHEVPTSTYTVPAAAHEDVPFSRVRKAIAEHMTRSLHTAAQLTNVIEVDMTRVAALRAQAKDAFKATEGFSLTFMPFIASAVVEALRVLPEFNAHILEDGGSARLFKEVNLGVAVGRDEGLIVPVVHGADGMNLIGLARAINDIGNRARTKGGLKPDDVVGGTFSITNYGSFGGLIDTPIISMPQVAILGVGAIVKRPAVLEIDGADAVAIRQMMFLSLTYDHRWIDGHKAAQFNGRLKAILEDADYAHELGIDV